MTDLIIQSSSGRRGPCDTYRIGIREGCRSPVIGRYSGADERPVGLGLADLKHSKSDDLVLQSAPLSPPDIQHGISEASLQIQREACVVYEEDLGPHAHNSTSLPVYFSDSETAKRPIIDKPPLKITGDFGTDISSKRSSQYIYDRIDPEDSIKDIISENDFYRFVLFKRHYEKYLDISKRYEEARNIAYYLEEKYHEIKAERDILANSNRELERRLEEKDTEMHEKEDELFLQLEKAIRLEEDFEKLKIEKEKIAEWKDRLEKEKNEAYRQVNDLKLVAKQSATLNSQLKKGMKHLASCRRRKCSVCAYTRATFGDYNNVRGAKLLSCFHGGMGNEKRNKGLRQDAVNRHESTRNEDEEDCSSPGGTPDLSLRLSHLSLSRPHMSYIDECSSDSDTDVEPRYPPSDRSSTHAPHAFSSDSGFSSEICDPASLTPTKSFTRATKWTSSFRKLIRRVSKKQLSSTT
ncbi:uncharacterized protein isoform X3 [Rhodnius prolixus]|uniref:uncharacterized protein isoform X3 n=1 Tax=Rhodnius prolixus TaxID=13249 RepID=UPI003D18A164